jgi:3-hydroxy-9,10-secoandrosta-1,3,5(10)-triene-9,17-dione monooxygenase reductase component
MVPTMAPSSPTARTSTNVDGAWSLVRVPSRYTKELVPPLSLKLTPTATPEPLMSLKLSSLPGMFTTVGRALSQMSSGCFSTFVGSGPYEVVEIVGHESSAAGVKDCDTAAGATVYVSGVTVHYTDPFATPEGDRSPVRRFRGRLPSAVTLWTAPGPAGLTVSSTLVADGEPARVFGLLDAESDLFEAVSEHGVFAVVALAAGDRQLADRFAGLMPAPGGLFAGGGWHETPYGPVPETPHPWAACRLVDTRPAGWSVLVEAEVVTVELAEAEPLVHYRGRYRAVD